MASAIEASLFSVANHSVLVRSATPLRLRAAPLNAQDHFLGVVGVAPEDVELHRAPVDVETLDEVDRLTGLPGVPRLVEHGGSALLERGGDRHRDSPTSRS